MTFDELVTLHYRTYFDHYVKHIRLKTRDFHAAEEIVHDGYVKALESRDERVVNLEEFNYWFYVLVRNAMVDYYRKEDVRRRADLTCFEQALLMVLNVEDTALREIVLKREVKGYIVGEMREKVIHDRFILQMKASDIAEKHGLSHGNVRTLLHRFQKDLEKRYDTDLHRRLGS